MQRRNKFQLVRTAQRKQSPLNILLVFEQKPPAMKALWKPPIRQKLSTELFMTAAKEETKETKVNKKYLFLCQAEQGWGPGCFVSSSL